MLVGAAAGLAASFWWYALMAKFEIRIRGVFCRILTVLTAYPLSRVLLTYIWLPVKEAMTMSLLTEAPFIAVVAAYYGLILTGLLTLPIGIALGALLSKEAST